jgi:tagatose 1,6-diphosphate aldolase
MVPRSVEEGHATMALAPGKLRALTRLADRDGFFRMVAVDQRPPIRRKIAATLGEAAITWERMGEVKGALLRALQPHASAMLLDPGYAYPYAFRDLDPAKGLLITLEQFEFDEMEGGGRITHPYPRWTPATIKRLGADGVKLMLFYRPDAPASVNERQHAFVREVGAACREAEIAFLLEPLVYPLTQDAAGAAAYVEDPAKRPEMVIETVREFAKPEYGIDIFKLETPVAAGQVPAPEEESSAAADCQAWFGRIDAMLDRPWVMLSAGAGMEPFRRILTYAFRAGASGYLAGRAIWWEAFEAYPDMARFEAGLADGGVAFMHRINALLRQHATPWTRRPAFRDGLAIVPGGEEFVARYP